MRVKDQAHAIGPFRNLPRRKADHRSQLHPMRNRGSRPLKAKLRPATLSRRTPTTFSLVTTRDTTLSHSSKPPYRCSLPFSLPSSKPLSTPLPFFHPSPISQPQRFASLWLPPLLHSLNNPPLERECDDSFFGRVCLYEGHVRGSHVCMDVYCLCTRVPVLERTSDAPTYTCDLRFSTAFATLSAKRSTDHQSVARCKRATPPASLRPRHD